MSDDAYSSFLDQANQDTGASKESSSAKPVSATTVDTDVPIILQKLDQYYVSEADEPFKPVSFKWKGESLPSEDELADLLGLDSNVSTLSVQAFDPRGEYKEVVQAVEAAGNKKTKIYKVIYGRTRAEYYVLSLDEQGGKVVGVRATAVES